MSTMQQSGQVTTLVLCVLGLYGSFITWSILQEKINTKPYILESGEVQYFKAPLVVNMVQSLFAIFVSFLHSQISKKPNPFLIFTKNEPSIATKYFKKFLIISITSSLSAPIGYQSLRHVDYLLYLLSKSCKLIPVMLVHFIFYQTRFPFYKYVVAVSVTAGVFIFTLSGSKSKKSSHDGNTTLGLAQLFGSMLLDGLTNSTQDQLFKEQKVMEEKIQKDSQKNTIKKLYKVDGNTLMCVLNAFMLVNTLIYSIGFKYHEEIQYTFEFIHKYPQVLMDIIIFAAFGATGQIFVFIILEKFDLIILTTATVTRKMLSMVLSVVLFGHSLNLQQILGVACVFCGIGYEAWIKVASKKKIE